MKEYFTNCAYSPAELIGEMIEKSKEIDYDELLDHITQETIDDVFPIYLECENLTLESDCATSYYKSEYDGKECVYIAHSAIEYIFI